ncbi:MAG: SDR family oxidoreductase [Kiritimatiellia bacterium]|nr:SDR family oxidoreductase [Kiritimatiellia bacterium]
MMKNALILGATSDLARALADGLARSGWSLTLAARDAEAVGRIASDLAIRHGAEAKAVVFDALELSRHAEFAASLPCRPDAVYAVFGYLGDPILARTDAEERRKILDTNFTAAVHVLDRFAAEMEKRGSGLIVGISSVAGDRGRRSHPYYCAAKAGFTAYLDALRGRLHSSGAHVMTVKPGFLRTRMTEGMKLPPLITATPDRAAAIILRAAEKRRDRVYVLGIWRWIMSVIRMIPERIFKRLPL